MSVCVLHISVQWAVVCLVDANSSHMLSVCRCRTQWPDRLAAWQQHVWKKNCANIGPNTSQNPSQSDLKLKNIERQLQKMYRCTLNGLCSKGVINFERTWLHFGSPRPSKFWAETWKNGCYKATHFSHRGWMFLKSFSEGFGNIFHVFFDRQQCQETHITEMLVMQENHSFCDVLYTSQTTQTKQKTKKFFNKLVTNDRFRGTPILSRFWKGLGRVLAHENCRILPFSAWFLGR